MSKLMRKVDNSRIIPNLFYLNCVSQQRIKFLAIFHCRLNSILAGISVSTENRTHCSTSEDSTHSFGKYDGEHYRSEINCPRCFATRLLVTNRKIWLLEGITNQ